ncbi:MAG: hypothetical protein JNJ54_25130 [Myxococcaceae bacterium]|nr:hypothetical protein [Myxococcaceae bacterium]
MSKPLVLVVLLAAVTALADLSPEEIATIQREQQKASDSVDAKYAGKGKLSAAELRAMSKEKAAAERSVLDAHGVKAGDWVKASSKMSSDDRAKVEATKKSLADKDEAAKKADARQGKEVVIEKGGEVNEAAEMDKKLGLGAGKK